MPVTRRELVRRIYIPEKAKNPEIFVFYFDNIGGHMTAKYPHEQTSACYAVTFVAVVTGARVRSFGVKARSVHVTAVAIFCTLVDV